jgi:hypothetical protein
VADTLLGGDNQRISLSTELIPFDAIHLNIKVRIRITKSWPDMRKMFAIVMSLVCCSYEPPKTKKIVLEKEACKCFQENP